MRSMAVQGYRRPGASTGWPISRITKTAQDHGPHGGNRARHDDEGGMGNKPFRVSKPDAAMAGSMARHSWSWENARLGRHLVDALVFPGLRIGHDALAGRGALLRLCPDNTFLASIGPPGLRAPWSLLLRLEKRFRVRLQARHRPASRQSPRGPRQLPGGNAAHPSVTPSLHYGPLARGRGS